MRGDVMYFLLTTGRIVTETNLRTAYEICNGSVPGTHPGHYEKWMHEIYGIIRSIPSDEITIEQLIKGGCVNEAIRVYSRRNGCTLREAMEEVHKMLGRFVIGKV
jgi:hypothetical protein